MASLCTTLQRLGNRSRATLFQGTNDLLKYNHNVDNEIETSGRNAASTQVALLIIGFLYIVIFTGSADGRATYRRCEPRDGCIYPGAIVFRVSLHSRHLCIIEEFCQQTSEFGILLLIIKSCKILNEKCAREKFDFTAPIERNQNISAI